MVKIFERLGHEVDHCPEITCCGQPAFNSGYWNEARPVAERTLDLLSDAEVVVDCFRFVRRDAEGLLSGAFS